MNKNDTHSTKSIKSKPHDPKAALARAEALLAKLEAKSSPKKSSSNKTDRKLPH